MKAMSFHTCAFLALTLFVQTANSLVIGDELQMARIANLSVDPCTDFYQYACGNFLSVFPNPDPRKGWTMFMLTKKEIYRKLKLLLQNEGNHASEAVMKAKKYYKQCRNFAWDNVDSLKKVLKELKGWPIVENDDDWSSWKLSTALEVAMKYQATPFFQVKIDHFNIPYRPLIRRPHFPRKTEYRFFKDAVTQTLVLMKYLNAPRLPEFSEKVTKDMWDLENDLRDFTGNDPHLESTSLDFPLDGTPRVFKKFDVVFQNLVKNYFGGILNWNQQIHMTQHGYFTALEETLLKYNNRTIASYITWSVIQELVTGLVNSPFPTPQQLASGSFRRETDAQKREEDCLKETIDLFEFAISALYIDVHTKKDNKEKIEKIAEIIKGEAANHRLKYLDNESYAKAKLKLDKMQFSIMYPPFMLDNQKIDDYYKTYNDTGDYLGMNIQHAIWRRDIDRKLISQSHDPDKFPISNLEVHAFVMHLYNRVYLLTGLTEKPLFYSDAPSEVHYGQVGVNLGHELLHLFLGHGIKYDKDGKNLLWVNENSLKKLEVEEKCFTDYYSSMKMFGNPINGQVTNKEMMPESGGLFLAYKALERLIGANELKAKTSVSNLDLTKAKTFFLSYAQRYCSYYHQDTSRAMFLNPCTFNNIRIEGTLKNSKEFAEAFGCRRGSTYNPQNKCQLY